MATPIVKKYIQSYLSNGSYEGNILVGQNQFNAIGVTSIYDICCDYNGNLYATDQEQHVVIKISSKGGVRILAGVLGVRGCDGNVVKAGNVSHFDTPKGIVCDKNGYIYVADSGNNQIKRISPNGVVNVFCGGSQGQDGYRNTYPFLLNNPTDVEINGGTHLYVADFGNNCVRCFRVGSRSSITIAGNGDEAAGDVNGVATDSRLNGPISLAIDNNGMLYVADSGNYKIKRINTGYKVNTFSGDGVRADLIGTSTRFLDLYGIKSNGFGSLLAWDYSEGMNGRLLRLNENGKSFLVRRFNNIDSVCVDGSGNIYSVENGYVTTVYSSSSSSSDSSSVTSSSSSDSTSSSSDSTNSSDSTLSSDSSSSAPGYRYFNNANNDQNWNTLSNWWLDETFTIPSDVLPVDGDIVHVYQPVSIWPEELVHLDEVYLFNNDNHNHHYFFENVVINIFNIENSYVSGNDLFANVMAYFGSTIYFTSYGSHKIYNASSVGGFLHGTTEFYDTSYVSFGSIRGYITFHENSYNQNGSLTPTNLNPPYYPDYISSVYGLATFNDNSYNLGLLRVSAKFNDNSRMLGTATPYTVYDPTATITVEFNDDSYMASSATITGDVTFNDNSYMESGATINGNVIVNYPAQNPLLGTVNGTITYVGYPANSSSSSSSSSSISSDSSQSSNSSSVSSVSSNSTSSSQSEDQGLSVRQSAKFQTSSVGTTVPFTLSSTPIVENGLLAFIGVNQFGAVRSVSAPDGTWTLLHSSVTSGLTGLYVFYKSVGASPVSSYTFTINGTGSEFHSGVIYEVQGIDAENPINAKSIATHATATTVTTNSVTPDIIGTLPISAAVTVVGTTTGVALNSVSSNWTIDQSARTTWLSTFGANKTLTVDTSTGINNTFTFNILTQSATSSIILLNPINTASSSSS